MQSIGDTPSESIKSTNYEKNSIPSVFNILTEEERKTKLDRIIENFNKEGIYTCEHKIEKNEYLNSTIYVSKYWN